MAKNILKEAIADAKAVREVALANAKAALEEAFTPKLQSMLSAKLSEELDEEMYDDGDEDMDEMDMGEMMTYDEDEDMDEMDMGEMMTYDEDEDMDEDMYEEKGEEDSMDEEIDLEEILNELELDEDDSEEEEQIDEMGSPIYKADGVQTNHMHKAEYVMENEEFNLDALLKEINDLDEKKKDPPTETPADIDTTLPETIEGSLPNEDLLKEAMGAEMFQALAGLVGVIGTAGIVTSLEMAMDDPTFQEKHPKAAEALKKIFGFLSKIGGGVSKGIKEDSYYESPELKATKATLETVKGELNEVNLLNSKLLYVNRIFKANNLDEGQKLRVVETLDKAESAKEAKLIYETIKDTFYVANSKKVSRKKQTKSLREGLGMASKAAGTSTARKEVIAESDNMVNRFQKLANIQINE